MRSKKMKMNKTIRLFTIIITLLITTTAFSISLKEVYDSASPQNEYDKYLNLETGVTYTGGLLIGKILSPFEYELTGEEGQNVKILGNGAVLDLQGEEICISYCDNFLDVEDCIIINGNIRYKGIDTEILVGVPTGSVRYVTFYQPHDYGIRTTGCGEGITIERNIVVDALETGNDYIYVTGISSDWIPTGSNFAVSGQTGFNGFPVITDNWSFHSETEDNETPLKHFSML